MSDPAQISSIKRISHRMILLTTTNTIWHNTCDTKFSIYLYSMILFTLLVTGVKSYRIYITFEDQTKAYKSRQVSLDQPFN